MAGERGGRLAGLVFSGLGIGASIARATSSPDIDAGIGAGADIEADTVDVSAVQAVLGDGSSAFARGASGGVLAGVNASKAEANNNGKVDAVIDDDSTLDVASRVAVSASNMVNKKA